MEIRFGYIISYKERLFFDINYNILSHLFLWWIKLSFADIFHNDKITMDLQVLLK